MENLSAAQEAALLSHAVMQRTASRGSTRDRRPRSGAERPQPESGRRAAATAQAEHARHLLSDLMEQILPTPQLDSLRRAQRAYREKLQWRRRTERAIATSLDVTAGAPRAKEVQALLKQTRAERAKLKKDEYQADTKRVIGDLMSHSVEAKVRCASRPRHSVLRPHARASRSYSRT